VLFGFQGTYRQIAIDWQSFTFPDQIDPYFGFVRETSEVAPGNNTVNTFDLTAGMIGYTERFYFGLVASHLTQPDVSFFTLERLPLKFTAHMGFTIPLGRKRLVTDLQNYLIPNVVYQIQGPYDQLTLSTAFSRGDFKGGLGFRTSTTNPDALVILVGYTPMEGSWGFGYSYDHTVSSLNNNLGGAHEISLSYQFPCRVPRKKTKAISCPKF
jgi:type IX secretion system PorP/SprF family membrane protein